MNEQEAPDQAPWAIDSSNNLGFQSLKLKEILERLIKNDTRFQNLSISCNITPEASLKMMNGSELFIELVPWSIPLPHCRSIRTRMAVLLRRPCFQLGSQVMSFQVQSCHFGFVSTNKT